MQSVSDTHWIVVSDLHGSIQRLGLIPGVAEAEGILVAGDLTTAGGIDKAYAVLESAAAVNGHIMALFGNMDRPEIAPWLDQQGIGLHRAVRALTPDTAIMGVGGSPFTPMGTPSEFPESHIAEWLDEMWVHARSFKHVILISHTPPYDTICDRIGSGIHVGSTAIRDFIMEHQPDICLCGHIHEARGEDKLGRTIVVNPGPLRDGGYAVLTLGEKVMVTRHLLD